MEYVRIVLSVETRGSFQSSEECKEAIKEEKEDKKRAINKETNILALS